MPRLPRPTPSRRLEHGHDHWCPSSHLGPRVTLRTKATNKKTEQEEPSSRRQHTSLGLMTSTFHLRNKLSWLSWLLCVLLHATQTCSCPTGHVQDCFSCLTEFQAKDNSLPRNAAPTSSFGAPRKPPLGNDVWVAWGGHPELQPQHVVTWPAAAARRPQGAGREGQPGAASPTAKPGYGFSSSRGPDQPPSERSH